MRPISRHMMSTNPARFPDEDFDDYKERRRGLSIMKKPLPVVLFVSKKGGLPALNADKQK